MFLVVRPGAPNSVLAPNVAMPFAPSRVLDPRAVGVGTPITGGRLCGLLRRCLRRRDPVGVERREGEYWDMGNASTYSSWKRSERSIHV